MFDSGEGSAPGPSTEGSAPGPSTEGSTPPPAELTEIERLADLLDGESAARPMIDLAWRNPHSLTALRIAIAYEILFGEDSE